MCQIGRFRCLVRTLRSSLPDFRMEFILNESAPTIHSAESRAVRAKYVPMPNFPPQYANQRQSVEWVITAAAITVSLSAHSICSELLYVFPLSATWRGAFLSSKFLPSGAI